MDPKGARQRCDELVARKGTVEDWRQFRDILLNAIIDAQRHLVGAQRALLQLRPPPDTASDVSRWTEEVAQLRSVKIEVEARLLALSVE